LEERYDQKRRVKRLDNKQEKTDAQIIGLQYRVKALTLTSEEYRKIRYRFLEVYRRDILDNVNKQERKKIGEGNKAAHNSDAAIDILLYIFGERRDETILVNLYSMSH
jgi:hypothetical protein